MLGQLRASIIYVSKLSLQKCLENAGISPAMSCSVTNFFADVAVQKEPIVGGGVAIAEWIMEVKQTNYSPI